MKRFLFTTFLLSLLLNLQAQGYMRIHQKGGQHLDISIAETDSVTFVDSTDENQDSGGLHGSWLWGSQTAGYYELLTFNDDFTYTAYDKYFEYDFDTMTYGWYFQHGAMLTLQSNGFGYQRICKWFVTSLVTNALEVMTRMGPFTYYKLQPETIRLQPGGRLSLEDGEDVFFTDNTIVSFEDGRLYGNMPGETYILKKTNDSILAYKVIVE